MEDLNSEGKGQVRNRHCYETENELLRLLVLWLYCVLLIFLQIPNFPFASNFGWVQLSAMNIDEIIQDWNFWKRDRERDLHWGLPISRNAVKSVWVFQISSKLSTHAYFRSSPPLSYSAFSRWICRENRNSQMRRCPLPWDQVYKPSSSASIPF